MSKSKFLGVALATLVAASLTACGGSEEKETRAVPSDWNDKTEGVSFVAPKSYVRENKSVTPPFIAAFEDEDGLMILADEQSQKDIVDIKVNNGECKAKYEGGNMGPVIVMEAFLRGEKKCNVKQVELTTKAGKVTYKF